MAESNWKELEKSGRRAPFGAQVSEAAPSYVMDVAIVIKGSKDAGKQTAAALRKLSTTKPQKRSYLAHSSLAGAGAAKDDNIELVRKFAKDFNLNETSYSEVTRTLRVNGTVADLNRAFKAGIKRYHHSRGDYVGREGSVYIPKEYADAVEAVFGLDERRQSKPYVVAAEPATTGASSNWLRRIEQQYNFPAALTGKGETIGILEFGGGYSEADLSTFFEIIGVGTSRSKKIIFEKVGDGDNTPNMDSRADLEVAMDIEIAGAVAPDAKIVVYFATNDEYGWQHGLEAAVYDKKNKPTILSISWGAPESRWGQDTLDMFNKILSDAAMMGITVCVASGDDGCSFNAKAQARVTFPASSPAVLACGGSALGTNGKEGVWNIPRVSASGGGISDAFEQPDWQKDTPRNRTITPPARITKREGRQLPDVAANAARNYNVFVSGNLMNGVGGTSVVAPLWAGIVARLNEALKKDNKDSKVGWLNPSLYGNQELQKAFNDVNDTGNNDINGCCGYESLRGRDLCTGWGSPNVSKLLAALRGKPWPTAASSPSGQ